MSTTQVTITEADGWVEVVDSSSDFLLENKTAVPVQIAFDTVAPALDTEGFHVLGFRGTMTRHVQGSVYARNPNTDVAVNVVVSI